MYVGNLQLQTTKQHTRNNLKPKLHWVIFKGCINANCLCESEGDICRQERYVHCNIIKKMSQGFQNKRLIQST